MRPAANHSNSSFADGGILSLTDVQAIVGIALPRRTLSQSKAKRLLRRLNAIARPLVENLHRRQISESVHIRGLVTDIGRIRTWLVGVNYRAEILRELAIADLEKLIQAGQIVPLGALARAMADGDLRGGLRRLIEIDRDLADLHRATRTVIRNPKSNSSIGPDIAAIHWEWIDPRDFGRDALLAFRDIMKVPIRLSRTSDAHARPHSPEGPAVRYLVALYAQLRRNVAADPRLAGVEHHPDLKRSSHTFAVWVRDLREQSA